MMALGKGVCSRETVNLHNPYLARIGLDYFVIRPCLKDHKEDAEARRRQISAVPLQDTYYVDHIDNQLRSCSILHEVCPIL